VEEYVNASKWRMVCLTLVVTACVDEDPSPGDAGIDSGSDECDGPRQHPLYTSVVEGTCLGPPHPVPGTCVTGLDSMTGNGEFLCSIVNGVPHVSFLEFGESVSYEPTDVDVDAGAPNPDELAQCRDALSRLQWPVFLDPDIDAGYECSLARTCLPYCDQP